MLDQGCFNADAQRRDNIDPTLKCWLGPVLESLFNKVEGLQDCNVIKKRLQHRCFPVKTGSALIFKCTYFEEPLRSTASEKPILRRSGWPSFVETLNIAMSKIS